MWGDAIKKLREQRGYSQSELARRAGVTSQAINRIEKGRNQPNAANAQQIAAALGVTVSELYQMAYGEQKAVTLAQLRSEGIPPAVLAELEDAAPGLSDEQWSILVAVARDMAQRRDKRPQRAVKPAQPAQPIEESEPPRNDRISARAPLRRATV